MSNVLGRGILGTVGLKRKAIAIPEWGGDVLVRELNAAEAIEAQQLATSAVDMKTEQIKDSSAMATFQLHLVVMGWINEDGTRVLAEGEEKLLLQESQSVITKISTAIANLSGLGNDAEEEAEKNS